MEIQIRRAEITDAPAIADLLRSLEFFAHLKAEPVQVTYERVAKHLTMRQADNSHSILVAQSSAGEVVGYGAVHWLPYLILTGPEGYISELFIRESYRGRQIGSQILKIIKAEAQERGCSRLMLLNRRQRESYRRQFYYKRGWEEREEMANFVYPLSGRL